MNSCNLGLTNTTVMHTANTHTHSVHAQLIPICRDRRHVVLIQSCVMKLAGARAGPYYMYYMSVCWRRREWVTDRAVAIIWSDLIENTRVASALQIKVLNSQCHLSAFCFFFFPFFKNKARRRSCEFRDSEAGSKGRTEKRREIWLQIKVVNVKMLCTCKNPQPVLFSRLSHMLCHLIATHRASFSAPLPPVSLWSHRIPALGRRLLASDTIRSCSWYTAVPILV